MYSIGPFTFGGVPGPYNSTRALASPMAKARGQGKSSKGMGKSSKGKDLVEDVPDEEIGTDNTDEQDMPTTIEELQQRVREQKCVIRAARSSYTQGYVKGRMDEAQRLQPIIDQMKIDYNEAFVKGKMQEYERLNELERDRLEVRRREIENKLAQNCIL